MGKTSLKRVSAFWVPLIYSSAELRGDSHIHTHDASHGNRPCLHPSAAKDRQFLTALPTSFAGASCMSTWGLSVPMGLRNHLIYMATCDVSIGDRQDGDLVVMLGLAPRILAYIVPPSPDRTGHTNIIVLICS